jgi:hypothetical protein
MTIDISDATWLPPLAPLNQPLADHLAGIESLPEGGRGRVTITNGVDLGELLEAHTRARYALAARVPAVRDTVYETMRQVIGSVPIGAGHGRGPLTTRAFLELLQQAVDEVCADLPPAERPTPTRSTIHRWRNSEGGSGLLRYRDQDDIDPQSAAAILLTRRLARTPHNWLPSGRHHFTAEDLSWWAWCYEHPGAAPVACSVAHLGDMPPCSLVFTPWKGAAWLDGWQGVPGGAFRWAGTPSVADLDIWYASGSLNAPEALKELLTRGQSTSEAASALHALSSLLNTENGYGADGTVPVSLLHVMFPHETISAARHSGNPLQGRSRL